MITWFNKCIGCRDLVRPRRRILSYSGDEKAESFLFQRLSIVLQRYVLLHKSFVGTDDPSLIHSRLLLIFLAFNPRNLYYSPEYKKNNICISIPQVVTSDGEVYM